MHKSQALLRPRGLSLAWTGFDRVLRADSSKVIPLLDRYGITPTGRANLRWTKEEPVVATVMASDDEVAERRSTRKVKLS